MKFQDLIKADPVQVEIKAGVYGLNVTIPKYYHLLPKELEQIDKLDDHVDIKNYLDTKEIKSLMGEKWLNVVKKEGLTEEYFNEFMEVDSEKASECLDTFVNRNILQKSKSIAIVLKERVEGLEGTIDEIAESIREQTEDLRDELWNFLISEANGIEYPLDELI